MNGKQRLELTWIGKNERPRLEPRILLADDERSYRSGKRVGDADSFDNRLIFGDNLLALKALESEFAGQVKCIYIDPPYNTGSAFEHYEDGLEHSIWLTLIRDRLEALKPLLATNGSIWVSIDDREMPYLKIVMDETFGRSNFVATVIWRKNYSPKSSAEHFSEDHDYVLIYAKDIVELDLNGMPRTEQQDAAYKNPDNDRRGPWKPGDLSARNPYSLGKYGFTTPGGRIVDGPPSGRYWAISKEKLFELDRDGRIWWGESKNNVPSLKRFLSEVRQSRVPQTFWNYDEVGHTQDAKKESVALFPDDPFGTPKPERLIQRVLQLGSDPGDLVLDSFAGSGTTGAVAHKMGRRWIMIEQGDHCHTHIIPRLRKVIDGEDPGGVTEATGWKGGGGFRYFRLAPSLIERDEWGNEIISSKYDGPMLAEAMCKHMGFAYDPSPDHFWMHGRSTERDFIYVTTAALTHEQLKKISDLVGPERTLLVCCRAFQGARVKQLPNLTVVKIPHAILSRCEWGKDDYSMGLSSLETAPAEAEEAAAPAEEPEPPRKRRKKTAAPATPSLFGDDTVGEDDQ
jgi:adenine-specific DNA-methyltransferase